MVLASKATETACPDKRGTDAEPAQPVPTKSPTQHFWDDTRDDWRFGTWRPEIARFVRHRGLVTAKDVGARFRVGPDIVRGRIDRMVREGTLERAGRGLFRIREAGPC